MTSILPPPQPASRKTRIVCISDTHNQTPKLPAGDVLIHSGDLTNQGSLSELKKQVAWLEAVDFEVKIVIAGMHAPCALRLRQSHFLASFYHNSRQGCGYIHIYVHNERPISDYGGKQGTTTSRSTRSSTSSTARTSTTSIRRTSKNARGC